MDQAQQLRNIVKQEGKKRPKARVITVTSGKGGVGKTSISVNLAIQFAHLGKRVVILDADFGLANIEVLLGIHPRYNLYDMMYEGKKLHEIVTVGPENVGFISGGSGIREMVHLSEEQLFGLAVSLTDLDHVADVIIIDTGAGIDDTIMKFTAESDDALIVVTPEPTSITDSYALLKTLDKQLGKEKGPKVQLLANRVSSVGEGKELYEKVNAVVKKFLGIQLDYLGHLPQDDNVSRAIIQQNPFSISYPDTAARRAIYSIAATLNGMEPEQEKKKGLAVIFKNLFHKI